MQKGLNCTSQPGMRLIPYHGLDDDALYDNTVHGMNNYRLLLVVGLLAAEILQSYCLISSGVEWGFWGDCLDVL